ncbi:MAG: GTPase Era [Filifactoraceae bacterium]
MNIKSIKSGFISIIGRPNVGKSTLINRIIGEKVAIISDKPQTTRTQIKAIYNDEETQMVFIDTPGMQSPRNKLGKHMQRSSESAMRDIDVILYVVDDSTFVGAKDSLIIENIRFKKAAKILAINKIDKLNNEELMKVILMYDKYKIFDEIVPISAHKGINVERLIDVLKRYMVYGPRFYPQDMLTDQPEKTMVSEIIREKILHYTDEEIPHGTIVQIDRMKNRKNRHEEDIVDIDSIIFCEREAHKKILIGSGGRKLKGIGSAARKDLEKLLQSKVNLKIWVKAKENWRDNENYIKGFGLSGSEDE